MKNISKQYKTPHSQSSPTGQKSSFLSKVTQPVKNQDDFSELKQIFRAKKKEFGLSDKSPKKVHEQIGFKGVKRKSEINKKSDQLKIQSPAQTKLASHKKELINSFQQLKFALSDFKDSDKAVRRGRERLLKKSGQKLVWISGADLKPVIANLRDGTIPLSVRSQTAMDWVNSLKPNQFRKGTVAINLNELKGFLHGFNRHQCTEHLIAYLIIQLHAQKKSHFVLNPKETFLSHFGFNNSYNKMSWTSKKLAFMNKVSQRIKGLGYVELCQLKQRIHKTGKVFYELYFKALNKFSKALTATQQNKAKKIIRQDFYKKSLKPPPTLFYAGLKPFKIKA